MVMGAPSRKSTMQRHVVNCLRRGRRKPGNMSMIPVTRLSTMQNSLSMPIVCNKGGRGRYKFRLRISSARGL